MAEGIQIRLTHMGRALPSPPYQAGTVRDSSILLDDIRRSAETRGLTEEPFYIPAGGFIDLTFTGIIAQSYENGDIRNLLDQGEISSSFLVGGELQYGMSGPAVIMAVAGVPTPDVYAATVDNCLFIVDTTNDPVTINLPSGALHGKGHIRVLDLGANAGVNNITVVPLNPDTISGGANTVLATNSGIWDFYWDSTSDWFVPVPLGGAPSGAAGGDLAGFYPNPTVPTTPTAAQKDALAGTSGAPAAGNPYVTDSDPRNTDSRAPNGAAAGDLGGNYPNPLVAALTTTTGPTSLVIGAVAVGQVLQRIGATLVGVALPGTLTPVATAVTPYALADGQFVEVTTGAGAFTVDLPNPGVAGERVVVKKVDAGVGIVTVDSNGGPNIDGAATFPLNVQYQSVTVVRGTAQWWIE